MKNTVIILKFKDPQNEIGFTEATTVSEAIKTIKAYQKHGYKIISHWVTSAE